MPPTRPIIGVTGPDAGGGAAWWFTRLAVWLAGGHAVRITPRRPRGIEGLHGLIVGGGADVDPKLYGVSESVGHVIPKEKAQEQRWVIYLVELFLLPLTWVARKLAGWAKSGGQDAARDVLELRLIGQAVAAGLPVLGICRGEQLLNVYFGGTLYRDLAGFYVEDPEVRTLLPRKQVTVVPGTRLASALGQRPGRVNALHRQAIARLGPGLRIAATDRNSIIQAIEHERLPFVVGVQWHPEYLPQLHEQRALFATLVRYGKRTSSGFTSSSARRDRECSDSAMSASYAG